MDQIAIYLPGIVLAFSAFLLSIMSPGPNILAIISLGLHADAPLWVGLILVIGTGSLSIAIHCLYALAFSTATMVRLYGRARRWIQGAPGAFFCIAGIRLLTSRA